MIPNAPRYPSYRPFTYPVQVPQPIQMPQPQRSFNVEPKVLIMAGMAGIIAIMLVLVGWLSNEVAQLRHQSPATTQSSQVSSFNDGWTTGLEDVQEVWKSSRAQVTHCLDTAPSTQLHRCLDAQK